MDLVNLDFVGCPPLTSDPVFLDQPFVVVSELSTFLVFHTSTMFPAGVRIRLNSLLALAPSNQWKAWAAATKSTQPDGRWVSSAVPLMLWKFLHPASVRSASSLISEFGSTQKTSFPLAKKSSENFPVPDPMSATTSLLLNPVWI